MGTKWMSIVVILFLCAVPECDFAVVINSTSENLTDSLVLTECTINTRVQAFCVSIHNCLALLTVLDAPTLKARRCGPRNENNKRPHVCCEQHYIGVTEAGNSTTLEEEADNKILSSSCGFQDVSSRIVGGEPSQEKEFPWLGKILRRDRLGELVFSCTGSLISPKVVLTTAHCIVAKAVVDAGELHSVTLGEREAQCASEATECMRNKKTVLISNHVIHSGYDMTSSNHADDIGLITLRDKVEFSDYISPICLLEREVDAVEYHVAGWGATENGTVSLTKMKTTLPPFSWEQCSKKYSTIHVKLTQQQICAGGLEGKDACQGDSGGPLMIRGKDMRWYVAGVVSFGLGCGRKGWPGIYIYVPRYIQWIKDNAREKVL